MFWRVRLHLNKALVKRGTLKKHDHRYSCLPSFFLLQVVCFSNLSLVSKLQKGSHGHPIIPLQLGEVFSYAAPYCFAEL